jgi:uncharacterized protein YkwD
VKQSVLGFLLGCVITGAVLGIYASGLKAELSAAQKDLEIQKKESQLQQNTSLRQEQSQLAQVSQQRDTCQAKFERGTFLYEVPLLGGPTRAWFLPVDVEPVYLGTAARNGTFTHYDPKTQMETVQFTAKTK